MAAEGQTETRWWTAGQLDSWTAGSDMCRAVNQSAATAYRCIYSGGIIWRLSFQCVVIKQRGLYGMCSTCLTGNWSFSWRPDPVSGFQPKWIPSSASPTTGYTYLSLLISIVKKKTPFSAPELIVHMILVLSINPSIIQFLKRRFLANDKLHFKTERSKECSQNYKIPIKNS